jgi:hypothetical protein
MLASCVSSVFFCKLQLLHQDILKVDWMLHMGFMWKADGGASAREPDALGTRSVPV